jgi:protocatechuate 3,4-dioxygenase beta subunit
MTMEQDDYQRGRLLTRREVLRLLGASGALVLVGCTQEEDSSTTAVPAGCVVRPEQTEGPYFVDEMLNRSDIRSDPTNGAIKEGVPLELALKVSQLASSRCTALPGAVVDLWSCDALGVYSDVEDRNFNSVGQKFLRGYQSTDANGVARFTTIYPGWYAGRTPHIHFKIRSAPSTRPGFEFTSQLYFDDTVTDRVHAQQPYLAQGERSVRNAPDGIFNRGGSQLLLELTPRGTGYASIFDVALQSS